MSEKAMFDECEECGIGNLCRDGDYNYVIFCQCGTVYDISYPKAVKKFKARQFVDYWGEKPCTTQNS